MEADPELGGSAGLEGHSVGQRVDTAACGCVCSTCKAGLRGRDLGGLDLKPLGELRLIRELAGGGCDLSVVGCDDLVVDIEFGCTGGATVCFDALFNADLCGHVGAAGLVVVDTVMVLARLSVDLVEEAKAGGGDSVGVELTFESGLVVAGCCGVELDVEADPELGGLAGLNVNTVCQSVGAVCSGCVCSASEAGLGRGDLSGLDLKTLSELGLIGEDSGRGLQVSIVGCDDLVVDIKLGCTGVCAAICFDALLNTNLGNGNRATGLVVVFTVVVLTAFSDDLVEEAIAGGRDAEGVELTFEVLNLVASGRLVALDLEADPELSGLTGLEFHSVRQGVDAVSGSHSGCAGECCLGAGDLSGLDLKTLSKVGLIRKLARRGLQVSVVGCNDLVVDNEVGSAGNRAINLDALFDAHLGDGDRTTGLVVVFAVRVLAVFGNDLVEEAEARSRNVASRDRTFEILDLVASGSFVALHVEADPELSGLARIEVDSVGQRVDAAACGCVCSTSEAGLGGGDLSGLDFETLSKVGLIRELAGVTSSIAIVGCNDLVVDIELGRAGDATVVFDALLDAQVRELRSFVFVDEGTGNGSGRIGLRAADVLKVDTAFGLGHGDVFADAVDALDVFELPLRVANLIFRNGEVGVGDLEGNKVRIILCVCFTEACRCQRRRVGGGDVPALHGCA